MAASFTRAPIAPDMASGHVVPFEMHGHPVYITHAERDIFYLAFVTEIPLVFAIATIVLWKKRRANNDKNR
ncbi:MAG TPA: hypothetical protein VMH86_00485 [Rhizomicrobium sp.]|nr:hypothetical protein [Rhizomicrobium sp.]